MVTISLRNYLQVWSLTSNSYAILYNLKKEQTMEETYTFPAYEEKMLAELKKFGIVQ